MKKGGLPGLSIPVIAQYGIPSYLAQFLCAYPHFGVTLEERVPSPCGSSRGGLDYFRGVTRNIIVVYGDKVTHGVPSIGFASARHGSTHDRPPFAAT